MEEKNRIFRENEGFFVNKKKQKDEYDIEYDKGRVRKVKKKKDNKIKASNNFQRTYEYYERRNEQRKNRTSQYESQYTQ